MMKRVSALLMILFVVLGNMNLNQVSALSSGDVANIVNLHDESNTTQETDNIKQLRNISFNEDWRFYLEGQSVPNAKDKEFDDSSWRKLDLPHDCSIEQPFNPQSLSGSGGGFLDGGVGWYRKTFVLPENMAGKRISIEFGGIYMDSSTYINGKFVGNYPYGYTTFTYDITDFVVADGVTQNVIAIKVNSEQPSSRWYSGSGIYRNVNLVVTNPAHISRYGTFVTTPTLETDYPNGNAKVNIKTKVQNDGGQPVSAIVKSTIYDSSNQVFSNTTETDSKQIDAKGTIQFNTGYNYWEAKSLVDRNTKPL